MVTMVCKYTPVELFAGFGEECRVLDAMAEDFDLSDAVAHVNLCGFGKAVIQAALSGEADELVLVNCCDVMRRAYEVVREADTCRFVYLLDLPHGCGPCQIDAFARSLRGLRDAWQEYSGRAFDMQRCLSAFHAKAAAREPYVGVLGVRVGRELQGMMETAFDMPVHNLTCTGNRRIVADDELLSACDEDAFFRAYARLLLGQIPCRRMNDPAGRRALFEDPALRGIVYHTMKFCDFYGPEFAQAKDMCQVPLLKIESDFTLQSAEQLRTRIEAFAESMDARRKEPSVAKRNEGNAVASFAGGYVAGIDSGSTSTDVVVLDMRGEIVATAIIPTGGGAGKSAETCLNQALEQAGLARELVSRVVTTGYGRAYIEEGDDSVTEISCHARGAHRLNPAVRTIIDIGGQDNKVIRVDENGQVQNFAMNDKCAAGTGRFLEMMAHALQISLEDMSQLGGTWKEDITISSMCSVFAESEVVSLVAQNKAVPDIVHGLNKSVAAKISTLVRRVGAEEAYMMTGGVAQNAGVVAAIEDKLGCKLFISELSQLCGALGAALFALDGYEG